MKLVGMILLVFALLFLTGFTPFYLIAQGRQLANDHLVKDEVGVKMIGSRPPRCVERCWNCGKCEAVQVPIASSRNAKRVEYSRGDDISSYKPMCWKCKCGNFFFNP